MTEKWIYVGNSSDLDINEAIKFSYPAGDGTGEKKSGLLIHLKTGFYAYEGKCTHMGADLNWNKSTAKIWCTLHDGMYNPENGAPFRGRPEKPLNKLKIKIEPKGDIYLIL